MRKTTQQSFDEAFSAATDLKQRKIADAASQLQEPPKVTTQSAFDRAYEAQKQLHDRKTSDITNYLGQFTYQPFINPNTDALVQSKSMRPPKYAVAPQEPRYQPEFLTNIKTLEKMREDFKDFHSKPKEIIPEAKLDVEARECTFKPKISLKAQNLPRDTNSLYSAGNSYTEKQREEWELEKLRHRLDKQEFEELGSVIESQFQGSFTNRDFVDRYQKLKTSKIYKYFDVSKPQQKIQTFENVSSPKQASGVEQVQVRDLMESMTFM